MPAASIRAWANCTTSGQRYGSTLLGRIEQLAQADQLDRAHPSIGTLVRSHTSTSRMSGRARWTAWIEFRFAGLLQQRL
jgi:hypothetical protein